MGLRIHTDVTPLISTSGPTRIPGAPADDRGEGGPRLESRIELEAAGRDVETPRTQQTGAGNDLGAGRQVESIEPPAQGDNRGVLVDTLV